MLEFGVMRLPSVGGSVALAMLVSGPALAQIPLYCPAAAGRHGLYPPGQRPPRPGERADRLRRHGDAGRGRRGADLALLRLPARRAAKRCRSRVTQGSAASMAKFSPKSGALRHRRAASGRQWRRGGRHHRQARIQPAPRAAELLQRHRQLRRRVRWPRPGAGRSSPGSPPIAGRRAASTRSRRR